MLAGTRSVMWGWTAVCELKRAMPRRAASALGRASRASCFVVEDLALEVGGLDEVAVDEGEGADAGAGEQRSGGGSGGPAADDGDVAVGEAALAGIADGAEEDLAGIAVGFVRREGASRRRVCCRKRIWAGRGCFAWFDR